MQPQSSLLKKIIIILTIIVVALGIFFGIKFYSASNEPTEQNNTDTTFGAVPFQNRTPTSDADISITNSTPEPLITTTTNSTSSVGKTRERLTQLWSAPVSGFDFVYKDIEVFATTSATSSTSTLKKTVLKNQEFIYIWDRTTGNIFENLASTSAVVRFSNHTLPRAEEAYFLDAFSILTRGLDTDNERIMTRYLALTKKTATSTAYDTYEQYVPLYTKQVALLPDSKKMFYFTEKTGQANISNADGTNITKAIGTILTEWLSQYVNKTTASITTKPSAYFPGYLFFVATTGSGANSYVLGGKYGFTTLVSPDGRKILYSEIRNDLLETVIYDIRTKNEITLSQSTLSEKCAWSSDSTLIYCAIPQELPLAPYPDVWYQGTTSFADNIWSVNPTTGEFALVVGLKKRFTTPIDAYNLKVSRNKKYLLFQDKYSLGLWRYDL